MTTAEQFIEMVREAGRQEFQQPGEIWLPELQLSYTLGCARRAHWDDHSKARLRRHLIIMGPTGSSKTTSAESFLLHYAGAKNFAEVRPEERARSPTFFEFQSGTSWERIRGGLSQTGVQIPIPKMTDLLLCGELLDFLGHSPSTRKQKIDSLNTFLESGKMTVSLVKMGDVVLSAEQEKTLERYGVTYLEDAGSIFYVAMSPFIACSRFFSEEELIEIAGSGFLSRLTVASWNPSRAEFLDWWKSETGIDISEHQPFIREVNQRMWELQWKNVPFPRAYVSRAMGMLDLLYTEAETEKNLHPAIFRSKRDVSFVAQCITGAAMMRITLDMLDSEENTVEKITYKEEDLEVAKRFITQRVNSLLSLLDVNNLENLGGLNKSEKIPEKERITQLDLLRAFILDERKGELLHKREFERIDLVTFMVNSDRFRCSESHAYRIIRRMRAAGLLLQPQQRLLRVEESLWKDEFSKFDPDWVDPRDENEDDEE